MMTHTRIRGTSVCVEPTHVVVAELDDWIERRRKGAVACASAHLLEEAKRRSDVAVALSRALVLPDGAPIAFFLTLLSRRRVRRTTGSDLFDAICRSSGRHRRHFLYGGTPEAVDRLVRNMRRLYPGIEICGYRSPPFRPLSPEEVQHEVDDINASRPDIVWVGLGAPKQELWMSARRPLLEAPVLIGVGAVFDFASGSTRRAPVLLRRLGLEWSYRLIQEPRRLGRRYLLQSPGFVVGAAFDLTIAVLGRGSGSRRSP